MPESTGHDLGPDHAGFKRLRMLRISMAVAVPAMVGITAAIGQIVLMREEIALFNGNELTVGIVLATWLVWTALVSGVISVLAGSWKCLRPLISAGACAAGVSLPATIWGLREVRLHLQAVPGESIGPVAIVFASVACLSVFCGLCGYQFSLAAKLYRQSCAVADRLATSYAYLYETIGFAIGAVLTGIFLQGHLGSFQIAAVAALVNGGLAICLVFRTMRWRITLTAVASAISVVLILRVAPGFERWTEERLWSGFNVALTKESVYGRIMMLESGGLRSIYQSGTLVANVPDQASAEEAVHYALLEHANPRKVMLVGGGMNGSVVEALKHPTIEQLDYVELDPALIEAYRSEFPAEWSKAFADRRVRVHAADGRQYLNSSREKFDALIVSLPDPENAQLNRFYTEEFYRSVRNHLAADGLIAVQIHGSENAASPTLAALLRTVKSTLSKVFPFVVVIPGDTVHYFGATRAGVLTEDPETLIHRLKARRIETQYVREYFIPFRMAADRMAEIHRLMEPESNIKINRDFVPVAYYFSATLWSAQFSRAYARVLDLVNKVAFWKLAATTVLTLALICLGAGVSRARTRSAAAFSVLATGFSLMAVQILVLFTFQCVYGYLYKELAALTGVFMAGMALGSWVGIRHIREVDHSKLARTAAMNQLAVAASAIVVLIVVSAMAHGISEGTASQAAHAAFLMVAAICGIAGGFQFPLACAIYEGQGAKSGSAILYAFDLIGGSCGALLLSGILIPVFGFWNTAWLAAVVSLAPAVLLIAAVRTSRPNLLPDALQIRSR